MYVRSVYTSHTGATSAAANVIRASELSKAALENTQAFKQDPKRYLDSHLMDISGVMRTNDQTGMNALLNENLKKGYFALIPDGVEKNKVSLKPITVASTAEAGSVIYAHWIPFKSGNVLPGYTDIPKYPHHAAREDSAMFAFTPGMNGCALEVREHPGRSDYYRVFHNQHPTSKQQSDMIDTVAGGPVDSFTEGEYFQHNSVALMPVSANVMHFNLHQGGWEFIGQPQGINPHNNAIQTMPQGRIVSRPLDAG
ncbi:MULTISPECIES: hypothetical protein [Dickeya]|uniref:hypothetical protein n=1 Tax=Dickeya TaxID=204037 RepID=UPI00039A7170|nr:MULTISPECIES: hypothetical protein [Dickeya]UGA50365.1 hypothetical protein QR68_17740 [Dickeya fangzhongdai]UWH06718.1 hypothetical protein K0H75_17740 [Dickeya fangzhongdai]WKV49774.1 hypothetical protein PL145_17910 [Dickeya fangzhongdai]WOY05583.1 hypothetical protein OGM21_05745 [Dickeya fangzhongdai]